VAQDFFPLSKDEALRQGLQWKDEEVKSSVANFSVVDSIHDVNESILTQALVCEKTGRSYRIIPQELKFYQRLEIPVPRYAPETRNELRIAQRNPYHLWDRVCAQCRASIQTSYAPDRPERVTCESCYLKQVY
jgi:hypothetical protein